MGQEAGKATGWGQIMPYWEFTRFFGSGQPLKGFKQGTDIFFLVRELFLTILRR